MTPRVACIVHLYIVPQTAAPFIGSRCFSRANAALVEVCVITLHYITLNYSTSPTRRSSRYVPLHCIILHYIANAASRRGTLHYIHFIKRPRNCLGPQYSTFHYIRLQYIRFIKRPRSCNTASALSVLHCIALHCIALHCIALHYITLHCAL